MNILINKMGYRDIRLLWLGSIDDDREYYETVMDEVKRFSLEGYVDFLGFSDKVYDFLSTIDVFLLPSLYETFGFVYIEAMSVGLPVIGTNNGEFPNIISLGASGKVISPYNEKEIADAIIYFYNLGIQFYLFWSFFLGTLYSYFYHFFYHFYLLHNPLYFLF